MNNGIGGFPKLCEKVCKTGSKGCDRVVRSAVSCGEDSIDALLGVDAIQCRELPEPDRTACLDSVAESAAQRLADVASAAAAAAGTCAGALQQCLSFCAGSI
jgi:hypothetical protein